MSDSLSTPVLVLNKVYQPISVVSARRALCWMYSGRACALDMRHESVDFHTWINFTPRADDTVIGTSSGPICVPRILMLVHYNRVPKGNVKLSRRNILLRDDFRCQYCRIQPPLKELNLDHVVPRSRGGRSTWENLVTSCRPCNLKKGGFLPDECGMKLLRKPLRPAWRTTVQLLASTVRFVEWEPFLASAAGAE